MKLKQWLALAGFIALCEGACYLGSLFTAPAIARWLCRAPPGPRSRRPTGCLRRCGPPSISSWVWRYILVWRHGVHRRLAKEALAVYALQLMLNVLWSALFFGLHNPGLALLGIVALWATILWTDAVS